MLSDVLTKYVFFNIWGAVSAPFLCHVFQNVSTRHKNDTASDSLFMIEVKNPLLLSSKLDASLDV